MSNTYKVLRDDIDIIHLGKDDDGSLLSLERKYFNFIPEIGEKVTIYQNDGQYIVNRLDVILQENISTKSKKITVLMAIFLWIGIYNFYLGRYVKAIIQLLLWLFGYFSDLGFLIIIAFIWQFIEAILIGFSKNGSYWHQDSDGKELR